MDTQRVKYYLFVAPFSIPVHFSNKFCGKAKKDAGRHKSYHTYALNQTMAKKKGTSSSSNPELIVVLPGDNVTKHIVFPTTVDKADPLVATSSSSANNSRPPQPLLKLGTGLRYDDATQQVYATLAGRLECPAANSNSHKAVYFVRTNVQRYRPALEDRVVGLVQERIGPDGNGGDWYRIHIGAAHPAILSNLSFEGATKRNKPFLQTGQLLYCRVSSVHPQGYLEPVLSCLLGPHDVGVPRKDWMTAEGVYGELKGGTVCRISTGLARELLKPGNVVLQALAVQHKLVFEVAIGVNGYLWIHSARPEYTVAIQNAIQNSEVLTEEQTRAMVQSLLYTVEKQIQKNRDAMEE